MFGEICDGPFDVCTCIECTRGHLLSMGVLDDGEMVRVDVWEAVAAPELNSGRTIRPVELAPL